MIKKNVIANLFKNWKKMIEMCFSEDIQISICIPLTPPKDTYNQKVGLLHGSVPPDHVKTWKNIAQLFFANQNNHFFF